MLTSKQRAYLRGLANTIPATQLSKERLYYNTNGLISNLYYMGVGMVGIFLVIGIIILATVLLNRVFSGKAKE